MGGEANNKNCYKYDILVFTKNNVHKTQSLNIHQPKPYHQPDHRHVHAIEIPTHRFSVICMYNPICSPNLGVVVGMELDVGMHTISTSKGHSEPVGCPSLGHGYEPHSVHLHAQPGGQTNSNPKLQKVFGCCSAKLRVFHTISGKGGLHTRICEFLCIFAQNGLHRQSPEMGG